MKNNVNQFSNSWIFVAFGLSILGRCALCVSAADVELYVSPRGNDSNPGTVSAPLKSLAAARDAARAYAGKEAVTVHVADGTYYLPETLVFAPEDSGSARHPVIYQADNEGHAILSGGSKLSLQWTPYRDGIFQAKTPQGLNIDQLFINGTSQRMARYPNYDASQSTAAYQGFAADAFSRERAAGWADPTGGYIHAMHRSRWGGYHYRITGKNADGEVTYEGGWQNNRRSGMHREFRMVENIFEELDAPGEWFHNAKTGTLYYKPEAGTDLNKAVVEVVRLRHLIEFQGSVETPVRFITLQGFTVRHAARTFMDTKEPMLRSDWTIYRGGAVMLTGTEDVKILDCEFDQVGGNAVFVNNYNRRTLVKECHIHDAGASGVCFVGDPDAVHNPLFNYGQKNDLAKIDRTPGAKTENYPALGIVEDCLIHGIGRVERQPAGVQIAMAMEITVRDCSIYDCARAGINIGDGCWGGHLIEGCDVFDTVLETHDHGSFNSWGRDRYWRSDRGTSQAAIDEDPTLPFLDAMKTTVIRDSRWRCDHGWDIDLDDGSSNYDIYNNLMLQGGLKFREGFRRRAWNNITVNNGFHPHVWFNNSEDEVFANIFMSQHKGVRAPTNTARGKKIDENLFFGANPKDQNRLLQLGWDVNSIAADPQFVDPEKGDYRVKASSPAFDIGFKNFPMDQFGVKAPRLRALARTPVLPILKATKEYDSGRNRRVVEWFGAKIKNIVGLGEVSAAGLPGEIGVSLIEVPVKSGAANAGLKVGDVILSCAGRKIETFVDLQRAWRKTSGRVSLEVWRAQKSVMMDVTNNEFTGVKGVTVITESRNNPTFERIMPVSGTDLAQGISPTVNAQTRNEPLATLTDGKLAINYGPVFANGIDNGMYRLDLGAMKAISKINTYSVAQGNRGHQVFCLFGSASADDPGFDVWNTGRFTFIAMVDTLTESYSKYMASSVRGPIGSFRWLVWAVDPINENENSAFQEFDVAGTR